MDSRNDKRTIRFHPQVAFWIVDGEGVVVLARDGQIEIVNEVGARILELADGSRSAQDIVAQIFEEFEVPQTQAQEDVHQFIEEMVSEQVLVWEG